MDITITIPDDQYQRVLDCHAQTHSYVEGPETKDQFFKRKIEEHITKSLEEKEYPEEVAKVFASTLAKIKSEVPIKVT